MPKLTIGMAVFSDYDHDHDDQQHDQQHHDDLPVGLRVAHELQLREILHAAPQRLR